MINYSDIEHWNEDEDDFIADEDELDPVFVLEDWLWEMDSFRLSYDWTEAQEAELIAAMNCLDRLKNSLTNDL